MEAIVRTILIVIGLAAVVALVVIVIYTSTAKSEPEPCNPIVSEETKCTN